MGEAADAPRRQDRWHPIGLLNVIGPMPPKFTGGKFRGTQPPGGTVSRIVFPSNVMPCL